MATNYPDGYDDFSVTSLPEDTPLSQAGPGATLNHPELHEAINDAVEALEHYAAQKTHDHSGDATDPKKGPKLRQSNTHEQPDTDTPQGIHHTLGLGGTQAATGDHRHDYSGSSIYNKGFEVCTSTSRPAEKFTGKMIWESDTNRMRVWSQFPGVRQAVQGLYSEDDFERVSTTSLGPDWDVKYLPFNDLLHGKLATPTGHSAVWTRPASGNLANRAIARRIKPADRYTQTFDQVISLATNDEVADWSNANANNPNSNDVYFRMSDDGQTYVRAALTWYKGNSGSIILTATNSGPVGEVPIGHLSAPTKTPDIVWSLRLVGNRFEAWMGLEPMGTIIDNENVVATGFKGWGFGMQGGDGGFLQSMPNEVAKIGIADYVYYNSSATWQLLPVGEMPRVALLAGRQQAINPTGSILEWDTVGEDNFGCFSPANKTSVRIKEAGMYHVHASIVWSSQMGGDRAGTALLINDQITPHMHWEFVRGFNYTPGFIQTVDVSAYMRLAEGDRVGVAAAHNGIGAQYTAYKKNSQIAQTSRLFMAFHSA